MALIEAGRVVTDRWRKAADDEALTDAPTIVSLARRLAEAAALDRRTAPLGILVPSKTDPDALTALLGTTALFAVEFPVFRDGRGFTIARALRERLGYKGEIRALGHVIPDQYVHLLRCGVSTVEVPDDKVGQWVEAKDLYHVAYQAAVTDDEPLSLLRRHVAVAKRG